MPVRGNTRIVGLALLLSAVLLAAIAILMEFPSDSIVPKVLYAVAAIDGAMGLILFARGSRSDGAEDDLASQARLSEQMNSLRFAGGSLRQRFLSSQKFNEVAGLVLRKQKIQAIKVAREATGLGLKEAKDLVEEIERAARKSGQSYS
jgi:hypothetical protein